MLVKILKWQLVTFKLVLGSFNHFPDMTRTTLLHNILTKLCSLHGMRAWKYLFDNNHFFKLALAFAHQPFLEIGGKTCWPQIACPSLSETLPSWKRPYHQYSVAD